MFLVQNRIEMPKDLVGTSDLVLWTAPLDRAKDTEMAIMCEILTGGAFGAAHHTIAAKAVLMKVAFLQYYKFAPWKRRRKMDRPTWKDSRKRPSQNRASAAEQGEGQHGGGDHSVSSPAARPTSRVLAIGPKIAL